MTEITLTAVKMQRDAPDNFLYEDADSRTRKLLLEPPEKLSCEQWLEVLLYCFEHPKLTSYAKARFRDRVLYLGCLFIPSLQKLDSANWRHHEFLDAWANCLEELRNRPYQAPRSYKYRPETLSAWWILDQFVDQISNSLRRPVFRNSGLEEIKEHESADSREQSSLLDPIEVKDFRRRLVEKNPKHWLSNWTLFLMVCLDERGVDEASWILGISRDEGNKLQSSLLELIHLKFPGINEDIADRHSVLSIDPLQSGAISALAFLREQCGQGNSSLSFELALLLSPPLSQVAAAKVYGVAEGTIGARVFMLRRHLKAAAKFWQNVREKLDIDG